MKTYIALLRGINLGSLRKMKMADLKLMFTELGYANVRTYIQTGNVVFSAADSLEASSIRNSIIQGIQKQFGFEVPVLVFTDEEYEDIIKNNPYLKEESADIERLHITFLQDQPKKEDIQFALEKNYAPDRFQVIKRASYIYCQNGYRETKLSNTFFEKNLNQEASTRNWKTVLKVWELVKGE